MNQAIKQFLAGEKIAGEFDIDIAGEKYHCEQILRFLAGKRLVIKATHRDQTLLMKLFVPNKKGWRELSREQHGYRACVEAGIPVPAEKLISDNFAGCLAVAYEFIPDASAFTLSSDHPSQRIPALMDLMVRCHQAGLYQQDIHADNILVAADRLYLIDLASVRGQSGQPLSANKSLKNLAMLVAQFEPDKQRFLLEKISLYFQARQWNYDANQRSGFMARVDKAWQKRKQNYLEKCFRPCTMTAYKKSAQQEYAFKRSFLKRSGDISIRELEQLISQGQLLKDGNSATVVKTRIAGREVVIKRYNIKSIWHFFERCWRPSRAANAWRQGNLLALLGIATPAVLGFMEQRYGPLRGKAYLVSEYVAATELAQAYSENQPTDTTLSQIKRIFNLMRAYRLSHGDMKASNLLLTATGQVELIDLDAMREHRFKWTFQRAFKRDQKRFLKNWQNTALEKIFTNTTEQLSNQ
jgi:tRNA A-37 threonylcarbamoyl transferase component Bud32